MSRFLAFLILLALLAATPARADEALPIGDGKTSSYPQQGYLWICHQQSGGGGAFRDGPWIKGNYWYPDQKIHIQGDVDWPNAYVSITDDSLLRAIKGNDLPKHGTGIYPVQRNDPAYNYDRNPNSIREQQVQFYLPANPQEAQYPSCVGGTIGFSLTGAWIFNAIDGEGRDAMAHEIQDKCNGHPEVKGQYHYHGPSPCWKDSSGAAGRHSDQVGYAFDGFGIYGNHGENGKVLTDADLDACHGHKHEVVWNGKVQTIYHYHITNEFPYTVGCFKGSYVNHQAEWGQSVQQGQQMEQALQWAAKQQYQQPQQNQQQCQSPGCQYYNNQQQAAPQQNNAQTYQNQQGGYAGYSGQQQQMQQGQYNQQQLNPRAILQGAAQSLGVNAETLRNAVGGPPPDFARAAQTLGIPEDQIRAAFRNAGAPQ